MKWKKGISPDEAKGEPKEDWEASQFNATIKSGLRPDGWLITEGVMKKVVEDLQGLVEKGEFLGFLGSDTSDLTKEFDLRNANPPAFLVKTVKEGESGDVLFTSEILKTPTGRTLKTMLEKGIMDSKYSVRPTIFGRTEEIKPKWWQLWGWIKVWRGEKRPQRVTDMKVSSFDIVPNKNFRCETWETEESEK